MQILSVNGGLPLALGAQSVDILGSGCGWERGTVVLSPGDDPQSPQATPLPVLAWGPTLIIFDMPTVGTLGQYVLFVRDVAGATASAVVSVVATEGGPIGVPGTIQIFSVNEGMPLQFGDQNIEILGAEFGIETGAVLLSLGSDPLVSTGVSLAVASWEPTRIHFHMPAIGMPGAYFLFVRNVNGFTSSAGMLVMVEPGEGLLITQSENWTLPYISIEPFIGRLLSHPPPQIPVGNAVSISVRTISHRTIPPQPSDPDTVTLRLTDSRGVQVIPEVVMTRLRRGIWQYLYQVVEDAPHGEWIARVKTLAGGFANQETFAAFVVTGD
jgi:hypothetical protein